MAEMSIDKINSIPKELAFSESEYENRLARLREAMDGAALDLLLVTNLPNVCYMTGFQTPLADWYHCLIVPRSGELILQVCDTELAAMNSLVTRIIGVSWERMDNAVSELVELLRDFDLENKRVGVELRRPGLKPLAFEVLKEAFPQTQFDDASNLVLQLRTIKSTAEVDHMRKAANYSIIGMRAAISAIELRATENDIGAAASSAMLAAGSEFFSIDPIVRSGRRSGVTHATCKRKSIEPGDPIFIELGGVYQRYCAPVLRTAVLGPPSKQIRHLADVALETLEYLYQNIRPGRSIADVARATRSIYESIGSDIATRHYHGYSVGISFPPVWVEHSLIIHEDSEEVFKPGMTFHTPRAFRVPGQIGIGFSETIVVNEKSCEPLAAYPRELTVI